MDKDLFEFSLRMGDNALVLAQRVSAWCGHAPALEEDIAMANVGLDLIGQAKLWLSLAGEIEEQGRSADDLAYRRDARAFRNSLLVEQPNGDYGATLMRQFLFDCWHHPMLVGLTKSLDPRIAGIAAKAAKEAEYHLDRSRDLAIRLGDGTAQSHARMQAALEDLWPFTGELTTPDAVDESLRARGLAPDLAGIRADFESLAARTLREATLVPPPSAMRKGGKTGYHSEELGYLLAEMQSLQRAYPGANW